MASIPGANGVVFTTTNAQTASTVAAAFAAAGTNYDPSGGAVTGTVVATDTAAGQVYLGNGTSVTGFLPDTTPANPGVAELPTTYETNTASSSTIYASDLSNANIINNNPTGTLFGYFGAGGGAGLGEGLYNTFRTDPGSHVAVAFGTMPSETTQSNVFYSSGQDTVTINGPASPSQTQGNQVDVNGTGADSISLLGGASLPFFLNNSTGTSTILGSAGSAIGVGGTGHTSVLAGSGTEAFNVDTSVGNVTLTGSSSGTDTFVFTHSLANETATGTTTATVNNFTSSDSITLKGYGLNASSAYTTSSSASGTVVTLNDGTKITFTGVTDPSQVTSHITLTSPT